MTAVGTPLHARRRAARRSRAPRATPPRSRCPGMAHMAIVGATIASGPRHRDRRGGRAHADGVLAVLDPPRTCRRSPAPPHLLPSLLGQAAPGESFFPMQDDVVHYAGQPVALVVADSLERAQHAASLVRVALRGRARRSRRSSRAATSAYEPERLFGGLMPGRNERGDVDAALAAADVRVDATFRMAANHHNPMEAPATVAVVGRRPADAPRLDDGHPRHPADRRAPARPAADARPRARRLRRRRLRHEGDGLAARDARRDGRARTSAARCKLMLTRPQMFTSQRAPRGAGAADRARRRRATAALTAIRHEKLSITSPFDDWAEPATGVSSQLYACANYQGVHRLIRGNTMTPTFTRGPGEALGVVRARDARWTSSRPRSAIDPLELRLRNHRRSTTAGNPWSSDGLDECLRARRRALRLGGARPGAAHARATGTG